MATADSEKDSPYVIIRSDGPCDLSGKTVDEISHIMRGLKSSASSILEDFDKKGSYEEIIDLKTLEKADIRVSRCLKNYEVSIGYHNDMGIGVTDATYDLVQHLRRVKKKLRSRVEFVSSNSLSGREIEEDQNKSERNKSLLDEIMNVSNSDRRKEEEEENAGGLLNNENGASGAASYLSPQGPSRRRSSDFYGFGSDSWFKYIPNPGMAITENSFKESRNARGTRGARGFGNFRGNFGQGRGRLSRNGRPYDEDEILAAMMEGLTNLANMQTRRSSTGFKLPEVKLMKFKGEPGTYEQFKVQFQAVMNSRDDLNPEFLAVQLMGCLEGYPKALCADIFSRLDDTTVFRMCDTLDKRFGNKKELARLKVEKLIRLKPIKELSLTNLLFLKNVLEGAIETLRVSNENEIYSEDGICYTHLIRVIPLSEYRDYSRFCRVGKEYECLETFLAWLVERYEEQMKIDKRILRKSYSESKRDKDWDKEYSFMFEDEEFKEEEEEEEFDSIYFQKKYGRTKKESEVKKVSKSSGEGQKFHKIDEICACCSEKHAVYQCDKWKKMSVTDRLKILREKQLCFHCLNSGHTIRQCVFKPEKKCGVKGCQRTHHYTVHVKLMNQIKWFLENDIETSDDEQE